MIVVSGARADYQTYMASKEELSPSVAMDVMGKIESTEALSDVEVLQKERAKEQLMEIIGQ